MELLAYTDLDLNRFEHLAATSKVWIYQADRELTTDETAEIRHLTADFVRQWASHGTALYAGGDLLFNRFLVLMVDESMAGASGCSIDSSVNFVRQLEQNFKIGFFDRLSFAWMSATGVLSAPKAVFKEWYHTGKISDNTLVFDNLVQTKAQLEAAWLIPLSASWHKRFV